MFCFDALDTFSFLDEWCSLLIYFDFFSFPTKAFQIWLQTNDLEHIFITGSFFYYAGGFDPPSCSDISPNPGMSDPLFIVKARKKSN